MTNYGLGRLISIDERDKEYPMRAQLPTVRAAALPEYKYWQGSLKLNQGETPECVGFSLTHYLIDSPVKHDAVWMRGQLARTGEGDGDFPTAVYHLAQDNDEWPGRDYEGSSVRGGTKGLAAKGFIGGYHWAQSIDDIILALCTVGPVVVGTNWYEQMFTPVNVSSQYRFMLQPKGQIAGGHAWKVDGVNREHRFFRMKNSWGADWGNAGYAYIMFDDLDKLVFQEEGGECVLTTEAPAS